jgi:hypothetical protein
MTIVEPIFNFHLKKRRILGEFEPFVHLKNPSARKISDSQDSP